MSGEATVERETFGVRKNERGAWCVYYGERMVSDHATRDGAVAAYRNHVKHGEVPPS